MLGKNSFVHRESSKHPVFPNYFANICSRGSYKNVPRDGNQPRQQGKGKKGICFPNKMNHVQITVTWEHRKL